MAGLTVRALVVPEAMAYAAMTYAAMAYAAMAYAAIAGVPVQFGLYSVPLAITGYAVFGTSRRVFIGPSPTVAALVGALFVVLGLLRMGWIAHFFAKPALDGFVAGLGVFIAVGRLDKPVGVTTSPAANTPSRFVRVPVVVTMQPSSSRST